MSAAFETASTPRQVGVYQLMEKIGSGAMGTVYRATHTVLGKQVALKLVPFDDPQSEASQRFLLEGVAASRVRHPNVVEVLDAGIDGKNAYLAMQLLEGETLADCLARQGRLPVTTAVDLTLPVCAALHTAHRAGVLHRDLKPANLFLADVGRGEPEPMLLDFGISKILGPIDAALTQNPSFLGTPLYIAPEQAEGAPGSALSDQYSLALTLYEALLGVRPFEQYRSSLVTLLRHVAAGEIRPACELDASIPVALSDILARALSADPSRRFASVQDWGAALLPFASETRRTLWQHAFVDTERTMTSVNAPVTSHPGAPRISVPVSVSVESSRPTRSQVNSIEQDSSRSAERSSISRRFLAPTAQDVQRSTSAEDQVPWDETIARSQAEPRVSRNSVGISVSKGPRATSSGKWVWALSAILALLTVFSTVILVRHEMNAQATNYPVVLHVDPPSATIVLDGQRVGAGTFVGTFLRDGRVHRLRFEHPAYESLSVVFQDSPPARDVRLIPKQRRRSPRARRNDAEQSSPASPVSPQTPTHLAPPSPTTRPGLPPMIAAPAPSPSRAPPPPAEQSPDSPPLVGHYTPAVPLESTAETLSVAEALESDAHGPVRPVTPENTPPSIDAGTKEKSRSIHTGNLDPWAD